MIIRLSPETLRVSLLNEVPIRQPNWGGTNDIKAVFHPFSILCSANAKSIRIKFKEGGLFSQVPLEVNAVASF